MLMWQERQDDELERIEDVKKALIAGRYSTMEQLYPEYIPSQSGGPVEYESVDDPQGAKDLFKLLEGKGVLRIEDLQGGE
jgi:hypothetical protein